MDSGNSSSFQSSSGGDEEYDSRAESISAFLNNNNNNNNPETHISSMPNQPLQQPNHYQTHQSYPTMFDPLSNFFDPLSSRSVTLSNPNSLLNLDMVWSKSVRSDPNSTHLGGLVPPSSSSNQNQNQIYVTRGVSTAFPGIQISQENAKQKRGHSVTDPNDQNTPINNNNTTNNTNVAVRNPKKRSRASRRAPTTVLTTDTTNFRAMVQEFTGIPSSPFTSSAFPRSRLDLFGSASSLRSSSGTHSLDISTQPPYNLLRPFAQKVQPPPPPPPFVSSSISSIVDGLVVSKDSNSSTTNNSTTSIDYQLSPSSSSTDHLGFLKPPLPQSHQLQQFLNINMQNPLINFHKYPLSNLGPKPLDISRSDPNLKMGSVFEEYGLTQGQFGGLSNNHWIDGVGSNENRSSTQNDNVDQGLLIRSINGGNYCNSERQVVNGNLNYSASSLDFHGDNKVPEINVTPRSEGILESWICPSD